MAIAESILSTAGTDDLSRNISPHSIEFCFEYGDGAMADEDFPSSIDTSIPARGFMMVNFP